MSELDLAVREFLAESYENLDQFERDLVSVEADPREVETLSRIFRTVHSIKGACGFLAYPRLESVSHAGEGLLSKLREGELEWSTEITSGLLALADVMRKLLGRIEASGQEGNENHDDLIHRLNQLQNENNDTPAPANSAPDHEPDAQSFTQNNATNLPESSSVADPVTAMFTPSAGVLDASIPDPVAGQHFVPTLIEARTESAASHESISTGHSASVRVDVGLLDKLMNLVGELVLARNQVLQHANVKENAGMLATSQRLNLITTELQEGVMKTRMQPMGNICNKFPRVVRDLALMCGKQVRFEMEGSETELDRTIIEAIKDPLTHLVRNSVDHGIERSEDRVRAGKSPVGCLRLRAFHESGQVIIEISDDGAGIDLEKVTRRGVEQGLITRDQATRMADHQVMQLIFLPGFSTAERVTNISGRGVGMDVVKTNIEQIGGTIELHSRPRQGTTFKIKIPLTLAIIPALIVKTGGESFAIPQVNLLELVRLEADDANRGIEFIKGVAILRLRGTLLTLIYLDRLLNLTSDNPATTGDRARPGVTKVNFAGIRDEQLRWKARLARLLRNVETIHPDEARAAEQNCELNKWMSGNAAHDFAGRPEFVQLLAANREFHKAVNAVVTAYHSDHPTDAHPAMAKLEKMLVHLQGRLTAMERSIEAIGTKNIVVLQAEGSRFGLVVDEINDTEEIVVKPLGKQLKGVTLFAGATIMGDGRVSLILDIAGLAKRARVADGMTDRLAATTQRSEQAASRDEKSAYLLLRHGKNGRLAMPLSHVSRLEEIPRERIEFSGEGEVVQYRNEILPLIRLSNMVTRLDHDAGQERGPLHVVVSAQAGQVVGLVVDEILDIVEDTIHLKPLKSKRGLMGRAVIQQRVTDVVDVPGLMRSVGYSGIAHEMEV